MPPYRLQQRPEINCNAVIYTLAKRKAHALYDASDEEAGYQARQRQVNTRQQSASTLATLGQLASSIFLQAFRGARDMALQLEITRWVESKALS